MRGHVLRVHQRPTAFSAEEILPTPKGFTKPVSELVVPGMGAFPCLPLPRQQELLVVLQWQRGGPAAAQQTHSCTSTLSKPSFCSGVKVLIHVKVQQMDKMNKWECSKGAIGGDVKDVYQKLGFIPQHLLQMLIMCSLNSFSWVLFIRKQFCTPGCLVGSPWFGPGQGGDFAYPSKVFPLFWGQEIFPRDAETAKRTGPRAGCLI